MQAQLPGGNGDIMMTLNYLATRFPASSLAALVTELEMTICRERS